MGGRSDACRELNAGAEYKFLLLRDTEILDAAASGQPVLQPLRAPATARPRLVRIVGIPEPGWALERGAGDHGRYAWKAGLGGDFEIVWHWVLLHDE